MLAVPRLPQPALLPPDGGDVRPDMRIDAQMLRIPLLRRVVLTMALATVLPLCGGCAPAARYAIKHVAFEGGKRIARSLPEPRDSDEAAESCADNDEGTGRRH